MDKRTKIIIVITSIVVICLLVIAGYFVFKKQNTSVVNGEDENTIIEETNENEIEQEDTNSLQEDNTIEEENTIEENIINNEISQAVQNNQEQPKEQIIGREEQESISENRGQTDEEKVIELVKNTWGANDNSVTFNIVNHDGDIYMVSVNNKETTAVLTWYQVNIVTGEVTE